MPRRVGVLAMAVALVLGVGLPAVLRQATAATPPACGRDDLPETGLQGDVPAADQSSGRAQQGYNCGVALVGSSDLGARGGNANMAWAGNCAYVASTNGVAVVDVGDPVHPRFVDTLHGPGSNFTLETIHAVVAPDRALLVAGRYGLVPGPQPAPVDIYDVRDCAHPKLLTTFGFPGNVHNLTLTKDGRRLYSTLPLQAADLTDPAHPVYLGNLEDGIKAAGGKGLSFAHEAWPSADGTRLYIGSQLNAQNDEYFTILDVSRWPQQPLVVLSQFVKPGHSIRAATIGGRRYLLHSDESVVDPTAKGCAPDLTPFGGPSVPFLTDISDERNPRTVGEFRLAINRPENCGAQLASGVNASVHYHDVDDPGRTTFALISAWNAGLRIVDLRDPANPREVAYFNPGQFGARLDKAWGHVRYDPRTGRIWLATETGGFWVLELEPQVRRALGLPTRPVLHPDGSRPRPALPPADAARLAVAANASPLYCTISGPQATVARAS